MRYIINKDVLVNAHQIRLERPYQVEYTYEYIYEDIPREVDDGEGNITIVNDKVLKETISTPHEPKLQSHEMVYDLDLIPSGVPKLTPDGKIVEATEADFLEWGIWTNEDVKNKLRAERSEAFEAMLVYDVAVINGDEIQTPEQKSQRDMFRLEWLNITDAYEENKAIAIARPIMPERIKYYVQYKGV